MSTHVVTTDNSGYCLRARLSDADHFIASSPPPAACLHPAEPEVVVSESSLSRSLIINLLNRDECSVVVAASAHPLLLIYEII